MQYKTYYYRTEQDEVLKPKAQSGQIKIRKYTKNTLLFKIRAFFWYRICLLPVSIFIKLFYGVKFNNRKVLKQIKGGFFVYANHTNCVLDAFMPSLICFSKKPTVIIDEKNLALPFWGKRLKFLGGLPIPTDLKYAKQFITQIKQDSISKPIIIYPEAHVWPYYTKIRAFDNTSFRYPVIYNKPLFVFTTTYRKSKFVFGTKVQIFIDGPFYPDLKLDRVIAQQQLRDIAFKTMEERSKHNTFCYAEYKRKDYD